MSESERLEREACKSKLREMWGICGITVFLESIADVIDEESRRAEQNGMNASLIEKRDSLAYHLRHVAK